MPFKRFYNAYLKGYINIEKLASCPKSLKQVLKKIAQFFFKGEFYSFLFQIDGIQRKLKYIYCWYTLLCQKLSSMAADGEAEARE
jgi:hypothetical protein